MPILKNVEKSIAQLEGFDISFFHRDGKDAHGALDNIPTYKYQNAAMGRMTVSDWKKNRFSQVYPGFDVAVYDGDGYEVTAGQTLLATVRETYY